MQSLFTLFVFKFENGFTAFAIRSVNSFDKCLVDVQVTVFFTDDFHTAYGPFPSYVTTAIVLVAKTVTAPPSVAARSLSTGTRLFLNYRSFYSFTGLTQNILDFNGTVSQFSIFPVSWTKATVGQEAPRTPLEKVRCAYCHGRRHSKHPGGQE
jgi:hypothetical protein